MVKSFRSFVLCGVIIVCLVEGFNYDTLKYCCDIGKNLASRQTICDIPTSPIAGVEKDDQQGCLDSVGSCCKAQLKETECELGLTDSKEGKCSTAAGTERKQCCDVCNFGKLAGAANQGCRNNIGLSPPYDQYFKSCCEEASVTKPPNLPTKITTVSRNDPLPLIENLCDISDLCAQICIPTTDSYRCDCNPGYALMTDGISCKELKPNPNTSKGTNRCEINNPCDHDCLDTGVAIQCTCREGFQLSKDNKSCKDIDECALGIHTCLDSEYCLNGDGFYDCVTYDDDEEDDLDYDKKCADGYKYNGEKHVCDDFDECQIPLICDNPSATCVNTIGSYECTGGKLVCPPGYFFKDSTQNCEDVDECLGGQDDCNRESQVCLNTKGNFTCIDKASKTNCPPGFKMNPITRICEDINECLEEADLCGVGEVCVNEAGGHICVTSDYGPRSSQPTGSSTTPARTVTSIPFPSRTNSFPITARTIAATSSITTSQKTSTTSTTTPRPHVVTTTTSTTTTTLRPTTSTTTSPSTTQSTTYSSYPYPSRPHERTTRLIPTYSGYYTSTPYIPVRRPIPEYHRPRDPTICSRGHKYSYDTQTCVDIDECTEEIEACDNYQDCYNSPGSYVCNCKVGFTMDPVTGACVDMNECQLGQYDCIDGQRCDNTIGSYLCSRVAGCGTGYTLNYASGLCEDDNECLLGTHSCDKLDKNLICRNTPGSYRCERVNRWYPKINVISRPTYQRFPNYTVVTGTMKKCLPGYYMDAYGQCQDINECESNPCRRGQKCINQRGRFECISVIQCRGGFELNEAGDGCVDINECTRGTHSCSSTQICKNHQGYHVCICPPGHKLVNNECVDINECEFYRDRICSFNSVCQNTIGSYKCICKDGFVEMGNKCVDIDECHEIPNLCHQSCVNLHGGYRCACQNGFTLHSDNRTCSDVDECEKFKDKHLCIGSCENTPGSYACRCPPGFKLGSDGRSCQDIDECSTQEPCKGRDSICFNTRGGYECPSIYCPQNYIRDKEHQSRCIKDITQCHYTGNCYNLPEQYTYHFINIISKLPLVSGPIRFFQMKGPSFETSSAKFSLNLENVKCPSNVERVNINYFRVNRERHRAYISFVQEIEGPQEIELSLEMQLYHNYTYTGKVVAKIFIYISQYSF